MLDVFYFISCISGVPIVMFFSNMCSCAFICLVLLVDWFSSLPFLYIQVFVLILNHVCMQTMIIILVYIIQNVLNRLVCLCVCVQKNVMVNEIAGYGGLNLLFLLIILSELIVICVIGYWLVCENFRE
jgi:hypothetical protein